MIGLTNFEQHANQKAGKSLLKVVTGNILTVAA